MNDPNVQVDQLKNIEGAIEAILYAAGYPVKYTKIAELLYREGYLTKAD